MKNNQATRQIGLYHLWEKLYSILLKPLSATAVTFDDRIRRFQSTAFIAYSISAIMNLASSMFISFIVTGICAVIMIIVWLMLENKKTKTAFYSLLAIINISLIILTYLEGYRSGIFLFFFAATISFSFLNEGGKLYNPLVAFFVCFSSFLLALTFASSEAHWQIISESMYRANMIFNILVSFLLISWMAYSLSSENKKQEKTLHDKQAFLDTLFNTSSYAEIVVSIDDKRVTNFNLGAALMLFNQNEINKANLIGVLLSDILQESKNENISDLHNQIFNSENWDVELVCTKANGTVFPSNVSIVTFNYGGRRYKKITIRDITEKKKMLDELRYAKKNAEHLAEIKTQFLSNMSHELRTPLNGIIGSVNLLLEEDYLNTQEEQLKVLKFSSEHMLNLINEILDLSKLDAAKIKLEKIAVDLNKFMKNVSAPFTNQFREKGIDFNIRLKGDLPRNILADPTRLSQVMNNLLSNSLKFTSYGAVDFTIEVKETKSEYAVLEFSVADTGIGMSKETQRKIFEPFTQADVKTTRKYGGTGLGLAISQKLINLMGGQIDIDSKYNAGSRFHFTLEFPFSNAKQKDIAAKADTVSGELKKLAGLKILLAEDNPINMMIASKFLDKWGISYVKANNGAEAVSLFKNSPFDGLLMDLEMPLMDGYQALTEIRKSSPEIPAIALTAAVFENMKANLIESGFNDYVQKPFKPQDLHSKLSYLYDEMKKTA